VNIFPTYLLKRHAVSIEAHFDFVLVLTYAFPRDLLGPLVPRGLTLDSMGKYGFIAVACVQTKHLRPKGFPKIIGQDFFLIGYRVFTRYCTSAGQNLRGLRILRTDTDSNTMVLAGNLLTHYHYRIANVLADKQGEDLKLSVKSTDGKGDIQLEATINSKNANSAETENGCLPEGSLFHSVRDALKFAGPMPFTFDYESQTDSIIRVEGVRHNWHPQPIVPTVAKPTFFNQDPFVGTEPIFCSAFFIQDIPYYWKAGVREVLPG
jgi:Uncharacterized conserved protein (COG2071)